MIPQNSPTVLVSFEDRKSMSDFVNESKYNPHIVSMDLHDHRADTLQITFRDEESKQQFESVTRLKMPDSVQKKKQTRKANKLDSRGLGVKRMDGLGRKTIKSQYKEFDPNSSKMEEADYPHKMYDKSGKEFTANTPADHDRMSKMGYSHKKPLNAKMHKCATKVEHAEWGVGSCIREQHAAPDAEGNIAWYDVMFEHGLERGVSTDDLSVLLSEMHEDHDHHDVESIDEKVSSLKKSDAPFTVVATKGGKVVGSMHSLKHNEISDAIQFMKTDNRGAKISIEAKGGKVVHTESRDRFDYLDRQAASADRAFAAKKFMDALKRANIKHQYSRPSGTVMVLKKDLGKAQSIGRKLNVSRDGVSINVSMSLKEDVNERRFDPSKNPTAKLDKEFDDCKNALVKAGIPHMGQRAIGSMNRERNKFRVHPKFEKKARPILKKFKSCDLEINDKMPEMPMVRKSKVKEDIHREIHEMSAKAHFNKMKAQRMVGRGGRVVTPIDRNRFPNREREGLEGPFRNRKTSLIYYYDKKAGKYYDPQSDMYLDVRDVMDSVEEGLRQDLKQLKKNEGLRQAMSGPKETPAQKRKRKEKDNFDLYKKRQKRIAALRGDKSSRKLSPGQEKHYRQTVNLKQIKALSGVKKEDVNEDKVMERELELFIVNDANIYRQRIQPIIKNMQRKSKAGKYDADLAIKGFMYAVNDGIKAYNKEFGSGAMKLDKSSKTTVARAVRDRFADEF